MARPVASPAVPTAVSRSAEVSVPASSANLGAGFDCIALAVDRRLTVTAHIEPVGTGVVTIERSGTLAGLDIRPEKDLIYTGFKAAAEAKGYFFAGDIHFAAHSDIPVARGLGSSAAALVAGAQLANLIFDLGFDTAHLLDLCARIEGHPDNAAAALYGGAVLGVLQPGTTYTVTPLAVHETLAFIFAVPSFVVETTRARNALPPVIPYTQAVLAASRSAALVQGLASGNAELLAVGLDDVLHVPYRRAFIPGYDDVCQAAQAIGAYGTTLSGSGSTLLTVAHRNIAEEVCSCIRAAWEEAGVSCDTFVLSGRPAVGATHAALTPEAFTTT